MHHACKMRFRALLLAALGVLLAAASCSGRKEYREASGDVWTTAYHITYESSVNLEDSIHRIFAEVDGSLSVFNPNSLVSRINRNESGVRADWMLREVMEESLRVNRLTSGAFDPTVGPLVDLWGFGRKEPVGERVDSAAVDSVMRSVGIAECRVDERGVVIKKSPATEFDFSAIAKGYACDLIGRMFLRNGVENFLIEIGGELVGHGVNARGVPWRVLIEDPAVAGDEPYGPAAAGGESGGGQTTAVVELRDEAIATSGSYRRVRMAEGKRISHIINPATGRPAETEVVGATVIAPSCMTADAIATACMAMPVADAMQMARNFPDVQIRLVITGDQDRAFQVLNL